MADVQEIPALLEIRDVDSEPIVTIFPGGRVEVNPKYSTDQAATAFWNAVKEVVAKEQVRG